MERRSSQAGRRGSCSFVPHTTSAILCKVLVDTTMGVKPNELESSEVTCFRFSYYYFVLFEIHQGYNSVGEIRPVEHVFSHQADDSLKPIYCSRRYLELNSQGTSALFQQTLFENLIGASLK